MTNGQSQRRWFVRGRRLTVVVIIGLLALLAVRAVVDIWLGRRLTAEVARLEAKYGPLQWDSERNIHVWKTWPRRLAADNRARLLDAAAARVTVADDADTDVLYASFWPDASTVDQTREIADANREAIELAVRASQLRHWNWDIGDSRSVSNLTDLRHLAKVLTFAARVDTDAGRAEQAAADVMAGFAQAVAIVSEPSPVMLLVGISMAAAQEVALNDVLSRAEPSATALARLAAVIDEGVIDHPAREAMLGELKRSRAHWPRVERGWLREDEDHYPIRPSVWTRRVAWAIRPIIRFRALRDLAARARAVDAASVPPKERAAIVTAPLPRVATGSIESGDFWTAIMGRAAIGVALRRFRIDHGAYPNTLEELAPTYLKVMPVDPRSARPPEYRRTAASFELHGEAPRPGAKPPEWKVPR